MGVGFQTGENTDLRVTQCRGLLHLKVPDSSPYRPNNLAMEELVTLFVIPRKVPALLPGRAAGPALAGGAGVRLGPRSCVFNFNSVK